MIYYECKHPVTVTPLKFILVKTRKHKFRFVNMTDSFLVKFKFDTPAKAYDWLDQFFGPDNWEAEDTVTDPIC